MFNTDEGDDKSDTHTLKASEPFPSEDETFTIRLYNGPTPVLVVKLGCRGTDLINSLFNSTGPFKWLDTLSPTPDTHP